MDPIVFYICVVTGYFAISIIAYCISVALRRRHKHTWDKYGPSYLITRTHVDEMDGEVIRYTAKYQKRICLSCGKEDEVRIY